MYSAFYQKPIPRIDIEKGSGMRSYSLQSTCSKIPYLLLNDVLTYCSARGKSQTKCNGGYSTMRRCAKSPAHSLLVLHVDGGRVLEELLQGPLGAVLLQVGVHVEDVDHRGGELRPRPALRLGLLRPGAPGLQVGDHLLHRDAVLHP